tara:strand:- start:587 stop:1111 length:525 start_codon:yes stop_codon:yes gene_type:complete
MSESLLRKERRLWHKHFLPSLMAGVIVGIIAFFFEATVSNILLFASVGASAIILTNQHSHHLTKLHTTIVGYVSAIVLALAVYYLNTFYDLHIAVDIALLVFLVGLALFLFDSFHPPAITASISFIVLERPVFDLLYLFLAIIILMIVVRMGTYTISDNLPVKEFWREFLRELQ